MATTKMKPLTPREQECLDYIIEYKKETGELPTHVWLAKKLTPEVATEDLDRKTATAYISSLKLKGYLEPTGRFGSYKILVDN
jgi:hypothetical protein